MGREIAYAKINLALHVRRRRADGYHELETVFAFCEDGDVIEAEEADRLSLTIEGPFAEGLSATDNLVVRAAEALARGRGAAIRLTKNLPVASGIGGGSADAAAALRLLFRIWDVSLPDIATQAALGADVPACVVSQTMRGAGVGEVLVPGGDVAGTPTLLVNPRVPLSTGAVFKAWGGIDRGALGDWRAGRNDLEAPARELLPVIGDVLDWLRRQSGTMVVRMSGSGATCFALFDTLENRDVAVARVPPHWWHMASVLR